MTGTDTDGVVALRAPGPGDAEVLVAGRDDEMRRWLGPGDPAPAPTAVVTVGGEVVGWVDADPGPSWLAPGQLNIGYALLPAHRGRGYATRAVALLLRRLALDPATASGSVALLIDPANERSQAVARRLGCTPTGEVGGSTLFTRPAASA